MSDMEGRFSCVSQFDCGLWKTGQWVVLVGWSQALSGTGVGQTACDLDEVADSVSGCGAGLRTAVTGQSPKSPAL